MTNTTKQLTITDIKGMSYSFTIDESLFEPDWESPVIEFVDVTGVRHFFEQQILHSLSIA